MGKKKLNETQFSGDAKNKQVLSLIWKIVKNKRFTYTTLATSVLFFVISGIQFWGTDYMRLVLEMPEEIVFPAFSFITLTAPTLGCIIGGSMTQIMFGGYDNPNAIKLILYVGACGAIVSLPVPFIDSKVTFLTLFWLSLFAGGFIMPGLTGIIINASPKKHKALANSIAYVSYNILGYVPGPIVYGVITHFTGPTSRIGMIVLIYSLVLCVVLVFFSYRNSFAKVEIYKEFKTESQKAEESFELKRMESKLKRLDQSRADWAVQKPFHERERSFLEDLITPAAGIGVSPGGGNTSFRSNERKTWTRRGSGLENQLYKRFSEKQNEVIKPRFKTHKRGISLFDSTNMGVGLSGQPAPHIYQIHQNSLVRRQSRRSKSIFG